MVVSNYSFISKRISIVSVLILTAVYFTGIKSVPFHPDESQWIATSHVFEKYVSGQFSSPAWNQSYWTLTQPPVTRYVIGIGRRFGGFTSQELNSHWQFNLDKETNVTNGAMPSDSLLWWSRFPMAALSVLSILIGWGLLQKSFGRFVGVVWIGFCVINPYFLTLLRRAMGEASLLFFIMLAVYAGYRLLQIDAKEHNWIKLTFWIGMFGMMAGFAGAAKLNGLSILVAGVMIVLIIAIKEVNTVQRKLMFASCANMVMFLLAGFSFVGSNPFLWQNPIGRARKMLDHRLNEMDLQQARFIDAHIDSGLERVEVLPKRIFHTHATLDMKGMHLLNVGLFVIGIIRAIMMVAKTIAKQGLADKFSDASLISILLVGFFASLPALFTPLDWSRYYLLPVYFVTILIVVGFDWLVKELFQLLRGWGEK